ncbi:hypothetical protein RI367_006260 [Sorochytrium milnesiophthora]
MASEVANDSSRRPHKSSLQAVPSATPQPAANECPTCSKPAYAAEQILFEAKTYHKHCFKCSQCGRALNQTTAISFAGVLYCNVHGMSLHKEGRLVAKYDSGDPGGQSTTAGGSYTSSLSKRGSQRRTPLELPETPAEQTDPSLPVLEEEMLQPLRTQRPRKRSSKSDKLQPAASNNASDTSRSLSRTTSDAGSAFAPDSIVDAYRNMADDQHSSSPSRERSRRSSSQKSLTTGGGKQPRSRSSSSKRSQQLYHEAWESTPVIDLTGLDIVQADDIDIVVSPTQTVPATSNDSERAGSAGKLSVADSRSRTSSSVSVDSSDYRKSRSNSSIIRAYAHFHDSRSTTPEPPGAHGGAKGGGGGAATDSEDVAASFPNVSSSSNPSSTLSTPRTSFTLSRRSLTRSRSTTGEKRRSTQFFNFGESSKTVHHGSATDLTSASPSKEPAASLPSVQPSIESISQLLFLQGTGDKEVAEEAVYAEGFHSRKRVSMSRQKEPAAAPSSGNDLVDLLMRTQQQQKQQQTKQLPPTQEVNEKEEGLWECEVSDETDMIKAVEGFRIEALPKTYKRPVVELGKHHARTRHFFLNVDSDRAPENLLSSINSITQTGYDGYKLEHIDRQALFYRECFAGREHTNFVDTVDKLGPVVISVRKERIEVDGKKDFCFDVIVRRAEREPWMMHMIESDVRRIVKVNSKLNHRSVVSLVHPTLNAYNKFIKISSDKIEQRLISLDELRLAFQFKVGVLHMKAGQTNEDDIFSNNGSPAFDEFLPILGDQVELFGFEGFAGGLDTKKRCMGTHSVFTQYNHFSIMYHVSTLLPFSEKDPQQIARKRHIGNDIVCVVFLDDFDECSSEPKTFDPSVIKSHYLTVYIVVVRRIVDGQVQYRVSVTSEEEVPPFGPSLPQDGVFADTAHLREFLLAKIINAENAAYQSPKFRKLHARTRRMLIESIVSDYTKSHGSEPADSNDKSTSGSNSRPHSPSLPSAVSALLGIGSPGKSSSTAESSSPPPASNSSASASPTQNATNGRLSASGVDSSVGSANNSFVNPLLDVPAPSEAGSVRSSIVSLTSLMNRRSVVAPEGGSPSSNADRLSRRSSVRSNDESLKAKGLRSKASTFFSSMRKKSEEFERTPVNEEPSSRQ